MHRCVSLALLAITCAVTTATHAAVITVTQTNLTFNPSVVTAQPGDTIKWQWTNLSHTVTSGQNCVGNGLFNMALNNTHPVQTFVIPADMAPQTIDYFCTPHCGFGMTAQIIVEAPPPPSPDIDGDGCVGAADLALLLGAWGTSDPDADLDQDGTVGAADLGILLGAWNC